MASIPSSVNVANVAVSIACAAPRDVSMYSTIARGMLYGVQRSLVRIGVELEHLKATIGACRCGYAMRLIASIDAIIPTIERICNYAEPIGWVHDIIIRLGRLTFELTVFGSHLGMMPTPPASAQLASLSAEAGAVEAQLVEETKRNTRASYHALVAEAGTIDEARRWLRDCERYEGPLA